MMLNRQRILRSALFLLVSAMLSGISIAAERMLARPVDYSFAYKKDSEATTCTIQIAAVDRDITNGFGLEFGTLYSWERKTISIILYFNWKDVYTANGKVQKITPITINSASIFNENYSSSGQLNSFPQQNGEMWYISRDTAPIVEILKLVMSKSYGMTFTRSGSKIPTTVVIPNPIPKEEYRKFYDCFGVQVEMSRQR